MLISINEGCRHTAAVADDLENRVGILEDTSQKDGQDIAVLTERVNALSVRNDVLVGRLIRAEAKIERQDRDMTDIKNRSMRDNVIIRTKGDKYKTSIHEVTSQKFKTFLNDELHVPNTDQINIARAHRMGNRGEYNKMMIAKITQDEDMSKIFNNAKALKGTDYSISRQCPPEVEERRQFAWQAFKDARHNHQKARFDYMGRLIVNDEVQTKYEPVPLPPVSDALYVKDTRPKTPLIGNSDEHFEMQHEFRAWAASATDLQGVRDVHDFLMRTDVLSDATYVPYAYRYRDLSGNIVENFQSDGNYFAGLQILKTMRTQKAENIVIFINHKASPEMISNKKKVESLTKVTCGALLCLATFKKWSPWLGVIISDWDTLGT